MRVLALSPYPVEAATTRFRLAQLRGPLAERGIHLTLQPFMDARTFASLYDRSAWRGTTTGLLRAGLRRMEDVARAGRFDLLFVATEAMVFGPPVIEWLTLRLSGRRMVLDLDDATWVPYSSPIYGALSRAVRWRGKTDRLIRWSSLVTCGNRTVAAHVSSLGVPARIVPTVVDTARFVPARRWGADGVPVLGWIGSHSTFPYLESAFPVLEDLARSFRFRLRVVGSGRPEVRVAGVEVETVQWRLEREVADFQSLDVGLYPIPENPWSVGKSGLKAIEYMAVGIPYVASPVGAAAEIGVPGVTHFHASTPQEWRDALASLLTDPGLRRRMGADGRRHALAHYTVAHAAQALAAGLREALEVVQVTGHSRRRRP